MPFDDLPLLDTDRLEALLQAVGADALGALANRFGPSVDADLDRIRRGSSTDDRPLVAEAAHSLKGLAVTFGASRLQAVARALQMGADGSADLTSLVAEMEDAAASTKGAVVPTVASLGAATGSSPKD